MLTAPQPRRKYGSVKHAVIGKHCDKADAAMAAMGERRKVA